MAEPFAKVENLPVSFGDFFIEPVPLFNKGTQLSFEAAHIASGLILLDIFDGARLGKDD